MSRIDINRRFAQNWTTVARFSTLLWGGTKGVSTVAIRENAKCEKSAVFIFSTDSTTDGGKYALDWIQTVAALVTRVWIYHMRRR